MIRSMTGFGEAVRELPQGQLRATVKTVNHRSFNSHLRTPHGFDRFEAELQTLLKGFFSRGHINLTLVLERNRTAGPDGLPELDLEKAKHYHQLFQTLRSELEIEKELDVPTLLRHGDLLKAPEAEGADQAVDPEVVREVVDEATRGALEMRREEGARLVDDLTGRLHAMGEGLGVIEARAPERLRDERARLQAAIQELSQQVEVDEDRLAKEIAYLAERWDINEELVRFRAHIEAFQQAMDGAEEEPVGKRLGFLVQEMHREANTIASKANDLEIGHASVAIREEIERLREQLENVE